MKYQSELIKEIVDTRGHKESSLHYESECMETWIEEAKGGYPKLCDYESEWLNYISILDDTGGSEDPEPPIGEFPYVVLSDVTEATIDNVVPYAYKSAILKGKTDENLQSVKMPVLTTTGKNLFDGELENGAIISSTGANTPSADNVRSVGYIKVNPNASIVLSNDLNYSNNIIYEYDSNKDYIGRKITNPFTTSTNCQYIRFRSDSAQPNLDVKYQIEYGTQPTSYEPFKSNILTVNEDVTLRSNGSVYDELDLLTGKLTQRIDEDGEVLAKEVIKTVDLNIQDQNGKTLSVIKPIEGKMFLSASSDTIKPLFSGEIPVEAITQNLASFIDLD